MKKLLSQRKLLVPFIIIGLLAGLFLSLGNKSQAPDVTFTTLEGKNIKLSDLRGKTVLVNFWATDCPGCIKEMPELIDTYKQYHDKNFEIIAVAMPYDPPSQVLNYSKKNVLPFPVMHDGFGAISTKFDDVRLTPTSFIINPQGKIVQKSIGELNFTALHDYLDNRPKVAS